MLGQHRPDGSHEELESRRRQVLSHDDKESIHQRNCNAPKAHEHFEKGPVVGRTVPCPPPRVGRTVPCPPPRVGRTVLCPPRRAEDCATDLGRNPGAHAMTGVTTWPATSVSRKSRPL